MHHQKEKVGVLLLRKLNYGVVLGVIL